MKKLQLAAICFVLMVGHVVLQGSAVFAGERVLRGIPSAEDVKRGLKPGSPAELQSGSAAERPALSVLILFAFDSADLTPEAKQQLKPVADALNSGELRQYRFVIEGHTDATGSAGYNRALSQSRAESVYDYLANVHGVDRSRLITVGRGESDLYVPTDPDADINRRVRFVNNGVRQ